MIRLVVFWTVCSALSLGAFCVLLVADRRLSVPMPYEVPLAFASMVVLAPVLLIAADKLRARRPIRIESIPQPAAPAPVPVAEPASVTHARTPRTRTARAAEGVVLLDLPLGQRTRGQAA
jgi:hypothetical protein